MSRNSRRTTGSRGGIRAAAVTGIFLAVLALVIFGLFRTRTFEVSGNSRHTPEEIRSDLVYDLATHNTLWLAWKYHASRTEPRAPYLGSVQVKILSPSKVRVNVTEKKLIGYIPYNSSNIYFDEDGTVLEMSADELPGAVKVTGIAMGEPVLYQKLPVEDTALMRTMLGLTRLMGENGLDTASVSFDENRSITAQIGTVEVSLGQDEYLEEKVSNLASIYPKVQSQTGVLNMSAFTGRNEAITFNEANAEPETEAQTDTVGADAGTTAEPQGADAGSTAEPPDTSQGAASPADGGQDEPQGADEQQDQTGQVGLDAFMVFDSSGTLRYDAHVVNGQVVDAYGNPIDGCSVNEDGNVVDAYWNVIDPMTGTLAQ